MSKGQTLKDLMHERLTAAAEEIFALFERTITEYEEELCRSKEENQQLKESFLSSGDPLDREGAQAPIPSPCPGPDLNPETTETQIKEEQVEQSVKQEEEQLPLSVPELSNVCVKDEESPLLEQRQTEHREETQGENTSSDDPPQILSQTEGDTDHSSDTDNDDDWEPRLRFPAEQMDTETDGDHYNSVQISDIRTVPIENMSVPEMSAVNNGDMSETEKGAGNHQCIICQMSFTSEQNLQKHNDHEHTGEKPYSCPICVKTFTRKSVLEKHIRTTHTNEKPFSCTVCKKTFGRKDCLRNHMRTHTGEKPFKCSTCKKAFADQSNLAVHRRIHTGERPYNCSLCDKSYGHKGCLKAHMRAHTGEKLHSCPLCGKCYGKKAYLDIHMRCHTGEKPYICSICCKAFAVNSNLTRHMRCHEEGKI